MAKFGLKYIKLFNRQIIAISDIVMSVFSSFFSLLAFHFLLELDPTPRLSLLAIGISFVASLISVRLFRTYRGIVRYTTLAETHRVVYAMMLKAGIFAVVYNLTLDYVGTFFYTQILFDFILSCFLLVASRVMIVNFYYNVMLRLWKNYPNIMIYGLTSASVSLANYIRSNKSMKFNIVGFITAEKILKDRVVLDYPVFYVQNEQEAQTVLTKHHINSIFYTNRDALRRSEELIDLAARLNITFRIAPLLEANARESHNIQLRDVQIEDLLGREEIKINLTHILERLGNRTVMVTGAAGSIGSELCRQLCNFHVKKLILVDFSETGTFNIDNELHEKYPGQDFQSIIADVRNRNRIEAIIREYRPQIIFHAAAYKHVPLMEKFPCEAILDNIEGTRNVADLAVGYNVEKFVMISTDKAVRPSNVMGATKRICEMYIQSLGNAIKLGLVEGCTTFITTRFGNVLGSNGSVIPTFRKQIAEGGPITITHPDIIRYFMTIPEACRLVFEAAFLGEGNDVFVFDMGKPVKILDLAKKMILLSGMRVDEDIKIKVIGLRPGEKLFEELLYQKENTLPTDNEKIFRANTIEYDYESLKKQIEVLFNHARANEVEEAVNLMKLIVPDYKSQHSEFEKLDKQTA